MKVGILTFHFAKNYGAVLQTLGTVLTLKKLGFHPEVIDFTAFGKRRLLQGLGPSSLRKYGMIVCVNQYFESLKANQLFGDFVARRIPLSRRIDQQSHLQLVSDDYQSVLVGSDQVWNSEIVRGSNVYYLPDINSKKIAWSASVGECTGGISPENLAKLDQFHRLSVRDSHTKKILQFAGLRQSIVVTADPTMVADINPLLSAIDSKLLNSLPKEFILVYAFKAVEGLAESVAFSKTELGLPVVAVGGIRIQSADINLGIKSVDVWLQLFKLSRFVITHSFHGVVFSMKNRKDFICIASATSQNQRAQDLLERYGCGDRLSAPTLGKHYQSLVSQSVDYEEAHRLIKQHVSESEQFLLESIMSQ